MSPRGARCCALRTNRHWPRARSVCALRCIRPESRTQVDEAGEAIGTDEFWGITPPRLGRHHWCRQRPFVNCGRCARPPLETLNRSVRSVTQVSLNRRRGHPCFARGKDETDVDTKLNREAHGDTLMSCQQWSYDSRCQVSRVLCDN